MLSSNFNRLGLDPKAIFYANYLWWSQGEGAADDWIKRYRSGRISPWLPRSLEQTEVSREAEEEAERFYRKEQAPREIPVNLTRVEQNRWFNKELFTYQARIALLMRMLEMAGFPAPSPQFDDLERVAIGMLKERDREAYLNYLNAQSTFERMRKAIGIVIEGDGAEPTATGATIAEKNKPE
jgi:hypothetical protein